MTRPTPPAQPAVPNRTADEEARAALKEGLERYAPKPEGMTAEAFADEINGRWFTKPYLAVKVAERDRVLLAAARQTWEAERARLVAQIQEVRAENARLRRQEWSRPDVE